jgi:hypothetical protein
MESRTVTIYGRQERVGDWIVVDPSQSRILASDATPEEALRKAGVASQRESDDEPRPIVMQVTDPSLTCLY